MARLLITERLGQKATATRGLAPEDSLKPVQLKPDAGEAGAASKPAVDAVQSPAYPQLLYVVLGLVVFLVAALMAWVLPQWFPNHNVTFTPTDGVSAFAVFFLAATLIERFLEPFSSWLVRATPPKSIQGQATSGHGLQFGQTKTTLLNNRTDNLQEVVTSEDPETTRSKNRQAAENETTAAQAVKNGTFLIWAVATLVSVFLAFYFSLSLPAAVGVKGATIGWLDVFITSAIIGAGTKPLHDLISTMQGSSQGSTTKDQ